MRDPYGILQFVVHFIAAVSASMTIILQIGQHYLPFQVSILFYLSSLLFSLCSSDDRYVERHLAIITCVP